MKRLLPELYQKNPNLHAYVFVSGDVSARRETAREMAKSMLCRNKTQDAEPCGQCDCCIKMAAGTHPDCIFVSGQEKTSVDDVRKIEDEAYLASNEADSKVFILEDADGYNVQSQNALLKIIEEPPRNVKFVLTASSLAGLLPTVRSRVCTLSGSAKDKKAIGDEIKRIKPALDESQVLCLAHFCEEFDDADIKSIDEKEIFDCVEKAYLYLSGKDKNALMTLPKKREELMTFLRVLMLAASQLALVKATGKMTDGLLCAKQLSECNTKVSMKRAHALYDVFEEGYLLAEGYANVNAVLSFLLENAK